MIDEKFNRVKEVLVGIWRFRDPDKENLMWAASWTHEGVFYDTYPQDTPEEALDIVWDKWNEVKIGKFEKEKLVRG